MYKTKLQELCQRRSWELPEYATTRQGPGHRLRFVSTITVSGRSFKSPEPCPTAKQSQNEAAKVAFDHFSATQPPKEAAPPPPAPQPDVRAENVMAESSSSENHEFYRMLADLEKLQPTIQETREISEANVTNQIQEDAVSKEHADMERFHKNQLQTLAQKRNLALPIYICDREGPVHASRFRCKVQIDGKTYETAEYYRTLKEAEHAAAKMALLSLSESGCDEGDCLMYKNLLQEFCQKQGCRLPVYNTNKTGEIHAPTFISTVEISGESFTGQKGQTKKMAEMNAAEVAYTILKKRKTSQSSTPLAQKSSVSYFATPSVAAAAANQGNTIYGTAGVLDTCHLSKKPELDIGTGSLEKFPLNVYEASNASQSNEISTIVEDDAAQRDMQHLYKNQLQTLAQKRGLALPTYTCQLEGSRFKCKVEIDGKTYETSETFKSQKQAEHVAAKLALMSILANSHVEGDSIMYKNLLQELTQKQGYALPKYTTEVSGETPLQTFISTVEINGEIFTGLGGRTKKLAEVNAAKVAYTILKERTPSQASVPRSLDNHGSNVHLSRSSVDRDNSISTQKDVINGAAMILRIGPNKPKQDVGDMIHVGSNSHTLASGGFDTITRTSQDQSISTFDHGQLRDPFPEALPLSAQKSSSVSSSSSLSDPNVHSSTPISCDLTSLPPNLIRVYPRSLNMKFPKENIVLSDENWVAVSSDPNYHRIKAMAS